MDKKIEKLVEWTLSQLEIYTLAFVAHTDGDITTGEFECYLLDTPKQILSHPDLALIDREHASIFFKESPTLYGRVTSWGWLPATPLAEALKEKQNG